MSDLNKANLKIEVENRIKKLEEEILELKELTRPVAPDCAIGRVSRMDAINNRSVSIAALSKKKEKLLALKSIVNHIYDNDFGKCIICNTEIPLGRILIIPESKKCMSCASR